MKVALFDEFKTLKKKLKTLEKSTEGHNMLRPTKELDEALEVNAMRDRCENEKARKKALEDELERLKEELHLTKHLKENSDNSFEMMKEEFIRVTTILRENYAHDTELWREEVETVAKEKTREMKQLERKLKEDIGEKKKRINQLEEVLGETRRQLEIAVQRRDYYEQKLNAVHSDKLGVERHLNDICRQKYLIELERNNLLETSAGVQRQSQVRMDTVGECLKQLVRELNISLETDPLDDEDSIRSCFDRIEHKVETERKELLTLIHGESHKVAEGEKLIKSIEKELSVLKNYYETTALFNESLVSNLKTENNTLKEEVQNLSNLVQERNDHELTWSLESEALGAQKTEYENLFKEMKLENITLKGEIIELKFILTKEAEKMSKYESDAESLSRENDALKDAHKVVLTEIQMENLALKEEISNLKCELNRKSSSVDELEQALESISSKKKTLEIQNEELLNQIELEINEKIHIRNTHDENIVALNSELESRICKVQEVSKMLIKTEQKIQEVTEKLIQSEQNLASVSEGNVALQALISQQSENVEELEKEKKQLSTCLQYTLNEVEILNKNLNREQNDGKELKEQVKALQAELHACYEQKESIDANLSELKLELIDKQQTEFNLKKKLTEVLENLQKETDTVHKNEKMIVSLEAELLSELNQAKQENTTLCDKMAELKEKVDELEANEIMYNTDLMIMEDKLKLTLDTSNLVEHYVGDESICNKTQETSDEIEHNMANKKTDDDIIKEMETLMFQQLEQKNRLLETKVKSYAFQVEELQQAQHRQKYYDHILEAVEDELAVLKKEMAVKDEKEEEMRNMFQQERQSLEATVAEERRRNEYFLDEFEKVVDGFERSASTLKYCLMDEKMKNRELVEMLAKLGVKWDVKGHGDY